MNNKTIEQKIQRTEKEIARLERQKKIKQHEAKQLERNRRNRRIFTRGGMLERFMQRPLLLTDDQVYRLLQTAFNTEAVQTMEKALISEAVQAVTKAAEGTNPDAKACIVPGYRSQLYTLHVRLRSARHAPNRVRRSEILFCGTKSTGTRPLRQQAGYPRKVG